MVSPLVGRVLLALAAGRPLALTELARAVDAPVSSVHRALHGLTAQGAVTSSGSGRQRRYELMPSPTGGHLVGLALATVPLDPALSSTARACSSVEYLARRGHLLVVVFRRHGDLLDEGRALRALARVGESAGLDIRARDHDEVRRELLVNAGLRTEMLAYTVLVGDTRQTFPDRSQHGVGGRPLGRLHPALRAPSRRLLQRLARETDVVSLRLFGSSVRTDFRPDSDVDVLLEVRGDVRRTLAARRTVQLALERATGRDVDVVTWAGLRPEVRRTVEREAVSLL